MGKGKMRHVWDGPGRWERAEVLRLEKLYQQGQSGNDMSPAKTIYHMFDASLPGAGTTQGMT